MAQDIRIGISLETDSSGLTEVERSLDGLLEKAQEIKSEFDGLSQDSFGLFGGQEPSQSLLDLRGQFSQQWSSGWEQDFQGLDQGLSAGISQGIQEGLARASRPGSRPGRSSARCPRRCWATCSTAWVPACRTLRAARPAAPAAWPIGAPRA